MVDPSSILALLVEPSDLGICQALGLANLSGLRENLARFGFFRGSVGEVFRVPVTCVREELRVMTVPFPWDE